MPTRLSVFIVNYNSASLAIRAASSVLNDFSEAEVIIVDNASKDREELAQASLPVTIIENQKNLGLSAALQQAYQESTGSHLLILNPDTVVLEGAIPLMMEALEDPEVGGVGPRFWWDHEKSMLLPPIPLPTVWDRCIDLLLQGRGGLSKWLVKKDIRTVMDFWSAESPQEAKMLSGAAIMTRRDVVRQVGIFDSTFFLYYEDSDWCQKVRKRRLKLLYHPQAEMVHLFNQSGKQNPQAAQHMLRSRELYLGRHFPKWKRRLALSVTSWIEKRTQPLEFEDLGEVSTPPTFTWEEEGDCLVQVGLGPSLHPAAGGFSSGTSFTLPAQVWTNLAPGEYWSRVVRLKGLDTLATYRWVKGG